MSGNYFYEIIHLFFLLQTPLATIAYNIALYKTATYCGRRAPHRLLDDLKDREVHFTDKCAEKANIEIYLGHAFRIDYVIVHPGKGNRRGQLDHFVVNRIGDSKIDLCAVYPGFLNVARMRVNCKPAKVDHSNVKIESQKNEGFHIVEMEIHFMEMMTSGRRSLGRGCFSSKLNGSKFEVSDWAQCQEECYKRSFVFVAIKDNKECTCIPALLLELEVSAAYCDILCDDFRGYCGGKETFSIKQLRPTLPYHMGCRKTTEEIFEHVASRGDMTIAKCLQICDSKRSRFANLQDGNLCTCGQNYDSFDPVNDDLCNVRCSGDPNFICGGNSYGSLYELCSQFNGLISDSPCSHIFQCDGPFDMHGDCDGRCKPGYYDYHCLTRQIVECGPKPCDLRSSTCDRDVCVCKNGFEYNTTALECLDIDECISGPCVNQFSMCQNLFGSYACECIPGYYKLKDNTCKREDRKPRKIISDELIGLLSGCVAILLVLTLFFGRYVWLKVKQKKDISGKTSLGNRISNRQAAF